MPCVPCPRRRVGRDLLLGLACSCHCDLLQANARRAHCATNTSAYQVWVAESSLLSQHYLAVFNLQASNLTATIDVATVRPQSLQVAFLVDQHHL